MEKMLTLRFLLSDTRAVLLHLAGPLTGNVVNVPSDIPLSHGETVRLVFSSGPRGRVVRLLHVQHLTIVGPPGQRLISGFAGQRLVVIPSAVVLASRSRCLLQGLLPTDAGYYPRAAGHLAERPAGAAQTILIYCVSGHGWCKAGGNQHDIGPGQLLVIPPGMPHHYGAADWHPWTIFWIHVVGDHLPAYLEALGITTARPVVSLGEDTLLKALFEEVLGELESGYAHLNLLYAAEAMGHLLGAMIRRRHQGQVGLPDPRQRIAQSVTMMKCALDKPLRMAQLAAVAGFSASAFARLFKDQTGYLPKDYFTRLKMHHACQLLDNSALTIKEIGFRLGYEDPLHFSRVFKLINELSPTEYRNKHKG
jgi:AraC family transcriptional regulator, arabinose operon regulatory protein